MGVEEALEESEGVFLVKIKNAFVPIERVHSVKTFKNFNCPMRE